MATAPPAMILIAVVPALSCPDTVRARQCVPRQISGISVQAFFRGGGRGGAALPRRSGKPSWCTLLALRRDLTFQRDPQAHRLPSVVCPSAAVVKRAQGLQKCFKIDSASVLSRSAQPSAPRLPFYSVADRPLRFSSSSSLASSSRHRSTFQGMSSTRWPLPRWHATQYCSFPFSFRQYFTAQ